MIVNAVFGYGGRFPLSLSGKQITCSHRLLSTSVKDAKERSFGEKSSVSGAALSGPLRATSTIHLSSNLTALSSLEGGLWRHFSISRQDYEKWDLKKFTRQDYKDFKNEYKPPPQEMKDDRKILFTKLMIAGFGFTFAVYVFFYLR